MQAGAEPTLVFVGPGLTSFEQLAASAGRSGVRTAWIGYPDSWARRIRRRAFVPVVTSADTVEGIAAGLRRIGTHRIVDVQASEYVLADTVAAARLAGVPPSLQAELDRRLRLSDKLTMSRLLATHGVAVPDTCDAAGVGAVDAAARLGLPLVVKGRVANGGSAVHVAASPAEAAAAAERFRGLGGAFYERHVRGRSSSYSAAYRPGGRVVHDAVYLTERVEADGLGPPDRIRVEHRPDVLATGRAVVGALGGSGLVNVNLITDADGRSWVHDVNLRPWGTMLALRAAGIDFAADYLRVLDLRKGEPEPARVRLDRSFHVFPGAALAVGDVDVAQGLAAFAAQVPEYVHWAGVGYVAAEAVRVAAILTRRRVRGRRG